jgi:putative ABC transport system ATP-binding protein
MVTDVFTFDGTTVSFNGVTALDRVSAGIPVGKLCVVAGSSGSGKSTLLRLCNRLEIPTSGRVMFHGTELSTLDPLSLRRKVGMVFQRPALFPGTVRENLLVAEPAASKATLAETLTHAELDGTFLDRAGDDLSGGEAQRVCLARTLICRPEVLLMDEPTSSLHPAASLALETTVRRLHTEQSVDIVWVTHDVTQIDRLAEHLLVLSRGRAVYSGDPDTNEAKLALETLTVEEES